MHFPMPEGDPCFFCENVNGNTHQWQVLEEGELTMTLLNGRQFEVGYTTNGRPHRHEPDELKVSLKSGCPQSESFDGVHPPTT